MDETERLRLIVLDMKLRLRDYAIPSSRRRTPTLGASGIRQMLKKPHANCCASMRARLRTMSVQDDEGLARRRVSPFTFQGAAVTPSSRPVGWLHA